MKKAIQHLKKSDPVLSAIIERVGPYRIEFREPCFETLVRSIVYQQLSGRVAAVIDTKVTTRMVGDLQAELVDDFFEGFARGAKANVHARILYGRSSHHKIEALFKAFARALRAACWRDQRMKRLLPSTKGVL